MTTDYTIRPLEIEDEEGSIRIDGTVVLFIP